MFGPTSNEDFEETYYDRREQLKSGLQSLFLDLEENHFDNGIDLLIKQQKKELEELEDKSKDGLGMFYGTISIPQELFSLSEMKIIYCYKNFENYLKILLNGSYKGVKSSQMYRWDNLINFFKSKNIDIKSFKYYKDIDQLRKVNNSIKHSKFRIDNDINSIDEFKNVTNVGYSHLLEFYKRVKKSPQKFISELSEYVYKDLYEFDNTRIKKISEDILLRMDENHVDTLIKNLKEGTQ